MERHKALISRTKTIGDGEEEGRRILPNLTHTHAQWRDKAQTKTIGDGEEEGAPTSHTHAQ